VVEGAPLLREYTRKGIVGSNPIFSAINFAVGIYEYFQYFGGVRLHSGTPARYPKFACIAAHSLPELSYARVEEGQWR
jgi:hypothetical protein